MRETDFIGYLPAAVSAQPSVEQGSAWPQKDYNRYNMRYQVFAATSDEVTDPTLIKYTCSGRRNSSRAPDQERTCRTHVTGKHDD